MAAHVVKPWLAAVLACTGCEWIAAIPDPQSAATSDSGIADDALVGDDATVRECTDSSECANPSPVCSSAGACTGCTLDSDCASAVCEASGACADAAQIVYAAPTGSGDACAQAMPCSFDTGFGKLSAATPILALAPGSYPRPNNSNYGGSAAVTIHGLGATLVGVNNGSFYTLISTSAGSLTLDGVTLDLQGTIGGTCTGGTFGMTRVTAFGGFSAFYSNGPCTVRVDRSHFRDNSLYALSFNTGTSVAITNSLFVNNNTGNTDALGAVFISGSTGSITHSTFVANLGDHAALHCMDSPGFQLASLVSWGHPRNGGIESACEVTYSVTDPGYTGAASNVHSDPQLTATFRLGASSPARGLADPASTLAHDFDGEARPQPAGSRGDAGADEVP